jgi:hypothetical protein
MPNHYHFLVCQNVEGSISKFLQSTFSSYSQAINIQQKHSGTLFQGKAKAKLIENDLLALHLARYIHVNPVEAGMVSAPEDWEFSDCRVWCNEAENSLTDLRLRDAEFKNGSEYVQFVKCGRKEIEKVSLNLVLFQEAL